MGMMMLWINHCLLCVDCSDRDGEKVGLLTNRQLEREDSALQYKMYVFVGIDTTVCC